MERGAAPAGLQTGTETRVWVCSAADLGRSVSPLPLIWFCIHVVTPVLSTALVETPALRVRAAGTPVGVEAAQRAAGRPGPVPPAVGTGLLCV